MVSFHLFALKFASSLSDTNTFFPGKHDVGSLSRKGRHASFNKRAHSHGPAAGHSHSHAHGHPRSSEPMKESQKPRRGE